MKEGLAIDPRDFLECIIQPTLERIGLASIAAEQLLLGTAIHESKLCYLRQNGGGPALGVYQMEPATHLDIWQNYLAHRPHMADSIGGLAVTWPAGADQLISNLTYATAMARVHYYRVPHPLPEPGNVEEIAKYHKIHYNTVLGKARIPEFILAYNEHVAPLYT